MSKGSSTKVDIPPALTDFYTKTANRLGSLQDYFFHDLFPGGNLGFGGETDPSKPEGGVPEGDKVQKADVNANVVPATGAVGATGNAFDPSTGRMLPGGLGAQTMAVAPATGRVATALQQPTGRMLPSGLGGGGMSAGGTGMNVNIGARNPTGTTGTEPGAGDGDVVPPTGGDTGTTRAIGGNGGTVRPHLPAGTGTGGDTGKTGDTGNTGDTGGDMPVDPNEFDIMTLLGQHPEAVPGLSAWQGMAEGYIPQMTNTPQAERDAITQILASVAESGNAPTVSQDDPAINAAKNYFWDTTAEGIKNANTLAGLGRSGAVGDSLARAWGSQLTPLIENQLSLKSAAADRLAREREAATQTLMQEGQNTRTGVNTAFQAASTAGATRRGVAKEQADAAEQERLRLLALGEQSLTGPMGLLPTSIGSTTGKNK